MSNGAEAAIAHVFMPEHSETVPADIAYATEHARREAVRVENSWRDALDPYKLQHSPLRRWNSRDERYEPCPPPDPGIAVPSYWRDLLLVQEADDRSAAALENPVLRGRDQGDPNRPESDGELAEARQRLKTNFEERFHIERELRDIVGAGNAFVPAGGPPLYIAEEFAVAARQRATLANALPQRELPMAGSHIEVPKLTVGGSVAIQASENAAVQETDPTSGLASSAKAVIAGQNDVSRQLLDFSRPGYDQVFAADLGRDLALKVDVQLVTGTNSNQQTEGLANVTGINTVTYTDASPTAAKLVSKIWAGFQAIAESGGGPSEPGPDNYIVAMAPRRLAYFEAAFGNTSGLPGIPPLPGQLVATPGVRTNLGAGTNQDEIYVIAKSEVFVALGRPVFSVYPEVGSSTLTVRLSARQYAAAMFSRQPKAIAQISGTGLVAQSL
jgi:Phage capsid family